MKKTIALLNKGFESSSVTTEEWTKFYTTFKKEFREVLGNLGCDTPMFSKGHFTLTCFFVDVNVEKNTNQIWYMSFGDVRGTDRKVLFRTATGLKDYTGGPNQYVSIDNLEEELLIILNNS